VDIGALYAEYGPAVRAHMRRRLADPDEADEVAQDVFVRAIRYADRYREAGHGPRAWLFTIARSLLVDHRRYVRSRQAVTEAYDDELMGSPSPMPESGPDVDLEPLLAVLTPKQRAVVEARYFRDLTFADVGRVVGCSTDAAKHIHRRAIDRMAHERIEASPRPPTPAPDTRVLPPSRFSLGPNHPYLVGRKREPTRRRRTRTAA
jgi:RNA polymerase sigma-70 factor (ECF subfamily)